MFFLYITNLILLVQLNYYDIYFSGLVMTYFMLFSYNLIYMNKLNKRCIFENTEIIKTHRIIYLNIKINYFIKRINVVVEFLENGNGFNLFYYILIHRASEKTLVPKKIWFQMYKIELQLNLPDNVWFLKMIIHLKV